MILVEVATPRQSSGHLFLDPAPKESKRRLETNSWHQPVTRTSATSEYHSNFKYGKKGECAKLYLWVWQKVRGLWDGCWKFCEFDKDFGTHLSWGFQLAPYPLKAWGIVAAGASMGGRLCCAALSVVMKTALCFWYLAWTGHDREVLASVRGS